MLAGNSSISLAGSEEQIIFFPAISQNAYNSLRKLYLRFVFVFRSFSQNFPLGAPELFREVKKLLVQKDELSFPSYNDDHELANDIKNFSIQKISNTRYDLDINVVLRPRQDLDADQGRTQDYS